MKVNNMSIVTGNPDLAYWLKRGKQRVKETTIAYYISEYKCPQCNIPFVTELKKKIKHSYFYGPGMYVEPGVLYEKGKLFHTMFDHFKQHYSLNSNSQYTNLCYAILQQLVIWEATSFSPKNAKKAQVVYILNSDFGIDIKLIAKMLHKEIAHIRRQSYKGMCAVRKDNMPSWIGNVLAKLEKEKNVNK